MKIGMLTSGGDCQGLNAALRGVAKTLYNEMGKGVTLYGIRDGYRGLIEGDYHEMKPDDFSDILTLGGTILGTSRQPFKQMQRPEEDSEQTKLGKMLKTVKKAGFDCLVILGGNGTHKTANLLRENGVNVVTLPKTIDNDLWGTELTFGFQSAVNIASEVIDSIHSTAFSHSRVFIVEIMGHKAGWLTLHAGIASGADVIVIPEIPYSAKKIAQAIEKRAKDGKRFSIIAIAEGAVKGVHTALRTRFVFQILLRIAGRFLKNLRMIERDFTRIEKRLYDSLKNEELIQLLGLSKSLVYFSSSLKGNEVTMEKVLRGRVLKLYEDDRDILEDALIEVRQAIEMASIYSNIMAGTMDAYASVVSNNLNIIMKVLTILTIIMTIPNIVFGFFGMNIGEGQIPGDWVWWMPLAITVIGCFFAWYMLKKKNLD